MKLLLCFATLVATALAVYGPSPRQVVSEYIYLDRYNNIPCPSGGPSVCATNGYTYTYFENDCRLNSYNIKQLFAGQAELTKVPSQYCPGAAAPGYPVASSAYSSPAVNPLLYGTTAFASAGYGPIAPGYSPYIVQPPNPAYNVQYVPAPAITTIVPTPVSSATYTLPGQPIVYNNPYGVPGPAPGVIPSPGYSRVYVSNAAYPAYVTPPPTPSTPTTAGTGSTPIPTPRPYGRSAPYGRAGAAPYAPYSTPASTSTPTTTPATTPATTPTSTPATTPSTTDSTSTTTPLPV